MNSKLISVGFFCGWFISLGICLFLSYENMQMRNDKINLLYSQQVVHGYNNSQSKRGDWDIFNLEDMDRFRKEGKLDGKIEALLLMDKFDGTIENEQVNKIIEIAEKSSADSLSTNPEFISLLCRAAYHKGISSMEQSNQEMLEEEYTKGYHKAIDDFTCPENGNMIVPKKNLDMNKPKN
jgi:hypothetical protein